MFDVIRASIAIPTIFTPKVIKGHTLVDGGLVNPIPIAPTLRDNTDLTIAVNLSARPVPVRQAEADADDGGRENGPDPGYRRSIALFVDALQRRLGVGDQEAGSDETVEKDVFDLISKSLETMQNSIARFQLAAYSPDITIDVPRDACSFYEFHRARHMIRVGWERADAVLGRRDRSDD